MKRTLLLSILTFLILGTGVAQNDIFSASANGNKTLIKGLLKDGADVNATNELKRTPLYVAVQHGQYKTAKYLIRNGADVNLADFTGETPLMVAVDKDNLKLVKLLIKIHIKLKLHG